MPVILTTDEERDVCEGSPSCGSLPSPWPVLLVAGAACGRPGWGLRILRCHYSAGLFGVAQGNFRPSRLMPLAQRSARGSASPGLACGELVRQIRQTRRKIEGCVRIMARSPD